MTVNGPMSKDQILALEPGPELNRLIGKHIFDIEKWCPEDPYDHDELCKCDRGKPHTIHFRETLPNFSEDITLAWLIIEKFRTGAPNHAAACIRLKINDWVGYPDCGVVIFGPSIAKVKVWAKEMPIAICRAALLAMIENVQERQE